MDAEVFVPFVFFGFLAAVILVPIMAKERTKRSAHDLIARAIDRGQPLDAELVSQMSTQFLQETDRARRSLGSAVVLIALAAGLLGAGYVIEGYGADGEALRAMAIPAVIVGTVGVAFLLLAVVDYLTKKRA